MANWPELIFSTHAQATRCKKASIFARSESIVFLRPAHYVHWGGVEWPTSYGPIVPVGVLSLQGACCFRPSCVALGCWGEGGGGYGFPLTNPGATMVLSRVGSTGPTAATLSRPKFQPPQSEGAGRGLAPRWGPGNREGGFSCPTPPPPPVSGVSAFGTTHRPPPPPPTLCPACSTGFDDETRLGFGRKCNGKGIFILSQYISAILGGNLQLRLKMYRLGMFYLQRVHFGHFGRKGIG